MSTQPLDSPPVFVSYAHEDRALVRPIVDQLQAGGLRAWIDQGTDTTAHGLQVGEDFAGRIVEAIGDASVLLLMMSPRSMASRHVRQEVKVAFEGEVPILPVMLEPTAIPAELQYILQGILYLDVDAPGFEDRLRSAVRSRVVASNIAPRSATLRRLFVATLLLVSLAGAGLTLLWGDYQDCQGDVQYYGAFVPVLNSTSRATRGMLRNWRSLKDDTSVLNPQAHAAIAQNQQRYWERYQDLRTAWEAHQASARGGSGDLHGSFDLTVAGYKDLHDHLVSRFDVIGGRINRLESKVSEGWVPDGGTGPQEREIKSDISDMLAVADSLLESVTERQAEFVRRQGRECSFL